MRLTADERIALMTFAGIFPLYLTKIERKGRTREELIQVIEWLTGYTVTQQQKLIEEKVTFARFFQEAQLHPNTHLVTGTICGIRIENIENPLSKQVRILDKLVDELAQGRKMEKILRTV